MDMIAIRIKKNLPSTAIEQVEVPHKFFIVSAFTSHIQWHSDVAMLHSAFHQPLPPSYQVTWCYFCRPHHAARLN